MAAQQAEVAQAQLAADEGQTIGVNTLTDAAPEAQLDPAVDPAAQLEEQMQAQAMVDEQVAAMAAQNPPIEPQVQPAIDQTAAETARLNNAPILGPDQTAAETNRLTGLTAAKAETAGAPTKQTTVVPKADWRVRLSLAPGANYLYKVAPGAAGILNPLQATDGVIFPYTPNIQVAYAAHYDPAELTHSNYKIFQYKNSSVDSITITCEFTAQDTAEANYLLAVIHFFRSVTKMFYGKDENPFRGVPPPLCYLTGLGQFQFDQHPLAITSFNYALPTDVDYVRSSSGTQVAGGNIGVGGIGGPQSIGAARTAAGGVTPGGGPAAPKFNFNTATNLQATYVPTKMQIVISAIPIVSRADISKEFSLKKYATGELLQGSKRPGGGGIW